MTQQTLHPIRRSLGARRNRILAVVVVFFTSMATASPESSFNLGVAAFRSEKYSQAFRHWTAAASHGNLDALNNLGYLLHNGYGVERNQTEAVDLWRTASFAGHPESQWHLGDAYENGSGIRKDRSRAYAWYRCAVESATRTFAKTKDDTEAGIMDDARKSLKKLLPALSQDELARGEALAKDLIRRYGQEAP